MSTSKAEVVGSTDALSGDVSGVAASSIPGDTARRPARPFARTSFFLSNALSRPKPPARPAQSDWGRPVGGSEGLGNLYPSSMNYMERRQVMGSVTTLTKISKNNLTGHLAEAVPDEGHPYMARCQSMAVFPTQSSPDAPPDYRSMHRSESESGLLLIQRTRSNEARPVQRDNDQTMEAKQDAVLPMTTSSSGSMTRFNCNNRVNLNAHSSALVAPGSTLDKHPSSLPVTVTSTPPTEQDLASLHRYQWSKDALDQPISPASRDCPSSYHSTLCHTPSVHSSLAAGSLDQQSGRIDSVTPTATPTSASSYFVDAPAVRSVEIAPPPSPPASVQSSSSLGQIIVPCTASKAAANDHGYPSPASSVHSEHRPSLVPPSPSRAAAGRVSFDLASASMLSPTAPRRGSAGIAPPLGSPPGLDSTSPTNSSRFLARLNLPGTSRRGSAEKPPIVEGKPRSRFKSFGKISRGSDAQRPPSTILGLKDSMQRWASASTDRLASSASDNRRSSMAVAREQATQPRKSLHLPVRDEDTEFRDLTQAPPRASFSVGPRSSFNVLRRGSAPQSGSPLTPERERRGSRESSGFFSSFGFGRNSKQAEPARSPGPVFQNSFLDTSPVSGETRSSALPEGLVPAYPANDLVAPGNVDPLQPVEDSAPAETTPLSSLPNNRALGIDQEQSPDATADESDILVSLPPNQIAQAHNSQGGASTDSTASHRTSSRSSRALAQLPRLNSMRAVSGGGGNGGSGSNGNGGGRDGNDGRAHLREETSEEEQEPSEDEEEDGDETGQTSDYHGMDSDEETDEEADQTTCSVLSDDSTAPSTSTPGGLNRNRPAASLVMPPAPTFIPSANPTQTHSSDEQAATAGFKQVVGRNGWTSFNATGFTPFETPTPNIHGSTPLTATANAVSDQTPRARQESSESSYFAARPGTTGMATAGSGSMSGTAPPPSPSIISRSRAPSSASLRQGRTPGSGSGPIPNRSMPAPAGTFLPMGLNRQLSGVSSRNEINRSKSPATSLKRPGTTGALTPQRSGRDATRTPSRETSTERPASESGPKREVVPNDSGLGNGPSKQKATSPSAIPAGLGSRPSFYHQKSKSLIDLLGPSNRRAELSGSSTPLTAPDSTSANVSPGKVPSYATAVEVQRGQRKMDGLAPIVTTSTAKAGLPSPGMASLGRRRSMFEMRAEPPPYSIIHIRPEGPQMILPREEEGKEKLPSYYCGVHIEGYLPRKLEFSAPGVQAKDRSWKRQYFVLHGTSLRVYRNDLSVERSASNGVWGEMKGVHVHLEPMNEDGTASTSLVSQAANKAISHTPLAHRGELAKTKDSTAFDTKHGLIRNYTLQSAESGLAADYLKRRHVVRVRAEGEQFLLQTRSDRHVVDWIEALQASTNVSADLESRQMPKFITLPRRRRRRRRDADGNAVTAEQQEARDLAEAQRRSVADSGAGSTAANSTNTSRRPSVAPDSTPQFSTGARPSTSAEDGLDPSAAFEQMLREDQEEIGRRNAADI